MRVDRTVLIARCGFASLAIGLGGVGVLAAPARGNLRALAPVTVSGPVLQLNRCQLNGDDNTPQLAGDPADPAHLVVTYYTGDDRAAVAAVSFDGGASWQRSVLPGMTSCTGGPAGQLVDPSLGFAPDGSIIATPGWVKSSPTVTDRDHDAIRQYASRSTDGGLTWGNPVDVGPTMPYQRGFLAHGPRGDELLETEQAPFAATTYAYGEPAGIDILSSADDGRSWRRSTTIPSLPGFGLLAAGLLRTGSSVVALAVRLNLAIAVPALAAGQLGVTDGSIPATLVAAVSRDGGRSFGPLITVARCDGGLTCNLPRGTVASSGTLFVTYTVKRGDGGYGLRVASSNDAGWHWTAHDVAHLRRVADIAAIAAHCGRIAVLELEPDDSHPNLDYAVLHYSATGGRTWSRLVLAGPFDKSTITYTHWDGQLGPEIDLADMRDGYGATYPVMRPYPLIDGEQDVVFQRILDTEVR